MTYLVLDSDRCFLITSASDSSHRARFFIAGATADLIRPSAEFAGSWDFSDPKS